MTMNRDIHIIDFEASGLSSESYPIEVAVRIADGTTYSSLIKPSSRWQYWDNHAEDLHGISREELYRFGKSPHEICVELNTLCEGNTLYCDWWVKDNSWLIALFAEAGVRCNFRCSPLELVVSEAEYCHWFELKKQFALQHNLRQHRALNDVTIIAGALSSLNCNVYYTKQLPMYGHAC